MKKSCSTVPSFRKTQILYYLMYKKSSVSSDEVTHHSISLLFTIDPKITLTKILIKLSLHNGFLKEICILECSGAAIGYEIQNLSPNTMYIIQIAPCDIKRQYSWSNILPIKTRKVPKPDILYESEKLVHSLPVETRELINARNIKDWKEYVNCSYKCAKPKEIRKQALERTLTWANSIGVLGEVYDIDDNCFQGPFVLKMKQNRDR